MQIARRVTELLLPSLLCPCFGRSPLRAPRQARTRGLSPTGRGLAAVLLAGYGNVPAERTAHLIGMLPGIPVSAACVDRASARLDEKLQAAGFDDAMQTALASEPVLGADETPVSVLTPDTDPDTGERDGTARADHPSAGRRTDLAAGTRVPARRSEHRDLVVLYRVPHHRWVHRLPADAAGTGGHPAVRRARDPPVPRGQQARARSLQSWAADVLTILREAQPAAGLA